MIRIESLEEFKGYLLLRGFTLSEQLKEGYIYISSINGDIIIFVLRNKYSKDRFFISVSFNMDTEISPNVVKLLERLPSFNYDPFNHSFQFYIDITDYFMIEGDLIYKDEYKVFLSKEELIKGLAKLHNYSSPFISYIFKNKKTLISRYDELSKYEKYVPMIYKIDRDDYSVILYFYVNCDLIS